MSGMCDVTALMQHVKDCTLKRTKLKANYYFVLLSNSMLNFELQSFLLFFFNLGKEKKKKKKGANKQKSNSSYFVRNPLGKFEKII